MPTLAMIGTLLRSIRQMVPAPVRSLTRSFALSLHRDYRDTLFLGGTGRSGTTWISDVINYDNTYRDMFEPFYATAIPICRRFFYGLYLRPGNDDEAYLGPARLVLSGRVTGQWIDQANRNWIARKRLVKEVRANLWLAWLRRHFPEIPIVFLMRHPCAVASSRVMLEWATRLPQFRAQPELLDDFLDPFRERIDRADDLFEKHVLVWCIQNYVPLKQFRAGEMHLAFYEKFCMEPAAEIERLFNFIGRPFDDRVLSRLHVPSHSTVPKSGVKTSTRSNLADAWRKRVSPDQVRTTVRLLAEFGLDGIYNQDTEPSREGAYAFMNGR